MKKYNINEIFYSVQGEGVNTGRPAVFIRFAGCNLNCAFCVTDFNIKEKLTAFEIRERIMEVANDKYQLIVLTGGEPALQFDEELYNSLPHGELAMETNGTIWNKDMRLIDTITVSPKITWQPQKDWILREGTELKLVYDGQDLDSFYKDTAFNYYYLQPMEIGGHYNFAEVVDAVKQNPERTISTQLQKIWKVR